MKKIIKSYEEAKDQIVTAVNKIADPVVQTLSPRGANVMFEDESGLVSVTNDGVTIAKQIESDDPIERNIIDAIKFAALRSNGEAGDGTTTATLLTQVLVFECMKLLDNGVSRLELKNLLDQMRDTLLSNLEGHKLEVTDDATLRKIAYVSASGDDEIADNVVEVIKSAGQDGMVMINVNHKPDTEVKIEPGFLLKQPLMYQELAQNRGFASVLEDVPVLITDKRLYYEQEAETILRTALESGHKKMVIVAADFIGKTPNFFLANHQAGAIELILIRETSGEVLSDLATYLGGDVVSEKSGSLVDNLSSEQFIQAAKVFANGHQSIFTSEAPDNDAVQERVSSLREEIDSSDNTRELESRLASLTNGTVTVKVGGHSQLEVQEKIARYDDAVRAARTAQKDGYVVGGGLTLLKLLDSTMWPPEHLPVVRKYCEASVRQIATNSGEYPDHAVDRVEGNIGLNAATLEYDDLLEVGIVDPYKVTQMAIENSISVTKAILLSGYFITNDNTQEDE